MTEMPKYVITILTCDGEDVIATLPTDQAMLHYTEHETWRDYQQRLSDALQSHYVLYKEIELDDETKLLVYKCR